MGRLDNKIAIITGGGTGIGEATCHRFAEEGARVAIFEISQENGQATLRALRAAGFEAEVFQVDVRDEPSVSAAVQKVLDRWGRIDILVNNAAIPGANKFTP